MSLTIRNIDRNDRRQWQVLWDGYNAFYDRSGTTALDPAITELTWERFFDPKEPVHCLVAADGAGLVGLTHYLFHRSTTRSTDVCYLQDLFTLQTFRGRGVGRMLIEAVVEAARRAGSGRVYWQTKFDNHTARGLYDKVAEHAGFIVYTIDVK
jgi:GNAT superfamily N-acetyltransferase